MHRSRSRTAVGIRVQQAAPDDLPQLNGLIERCSADTLYRRFHGASDQLVGREMQRIAVSTSTHSSWVAVDYDRVIRGTATLAVSSAGVAEAAFLVEDAWFRRGIGRSLFAALASAARHAGVETVVATIQADNHRAQRFLIALAPDAELTYVGGAEMHAVVQMTRYPPRCLTPAVAGARGSL